MTNGISVRIPDAVYDAIMLAIDSDRRLIPTGGNLDVQNCLLWPDPTRHPNVALVLIRGADEP